MPLTEKEVLEYVALYGADVERWPLAIRLQGIRASHNPAFASCFELERRFETQLLSRPVEPARSGLAERIIANTRTSPQPGFMDILTSLLYSALPRPALALAAVLTLGIVIGLSAPAPMMPDEQTYFETDGNGYEPLS